MTQQTKMTAAAYRQHIEKLDDALDLVAKQKRMARKAMDKGYWSSEDQQALLKIQEREHQLLKERRMTEVTRPTSDITTDELDAEFHHELEIYIMEECGYDELKGLERLIGKRRKKLQQGTNKSPSSDKEQNEKA